MLPPTPSFSVQNSRRGRQPRDSCWVVDVVSCLQRQNRTFTMRSPQQNAPTISSYFQVQAANHVSLHKDMRRAAARIASKDERKDILQVMKNASAIVARRSFDLLGRLSPVPSFCNPRNQHPTIHDSRRQKKEPKKNMKNFPPRDSRGDLRHLLYAHFLELMVEPLGVFVPRLDFFVVRTRGLPRRRDQHARRRALGLRCRPQVHLRWHVTGAGAAWREGPNRERKTGSIGICSRWRAARMILKKNASTVRFDMLRGSCTRNCLGSPPEKRK